GVAPVPAPTDEELFQGTWIVTAAAEDGNQTPAEKLKKAADDPNGPRIVIQKDRLSFVENGKSETLLFKLDSAKKPRTITFFDPRREDKPEVARGIYVVGADEFKLCYAKKDEGQPPADFTAGQGTGRRLFVARREKKGEAARPGAGNAGAKDRAPKEEAEPLLGVWNVSEVHGRGIKDKEKAGMW